MRLLLDTHIVLWRMLADPRLSVAAIEWMDDPRNTVEVSAVSVWEVAVKHGLRRDGRPALPISGRQFCDELRKVGLTPKAIAVEHIVALDDLPLHHRDPFDRLLVAQAKSEQMLLVTHDAQLAAYGDCVRLV